LKSFTFKFLARVPYTSFYYQKQIHNKLILSKEGAFQGRKTDEERMKLFDDWNKSVIDYVPKEKLLIYHPKEGWEPLCEFLNVKVPSIPYPHLNKTKNMGHMSRFINTMFIIIILLTTIGMVIAWWLFDITYFQ